MGTFNLLFLDAANGNSFGTTTGSEYRRLNSEHRAIWFSGAIDGMMAEAIGVTVELDRGNLVSKSELYGSHAPQSAKYWNWVGDCLEKYGQTELQERFESELERKPMEWSWPAASTARTAIVELCKPIPHPMIESPKTQ